MDRPRDKKRKLRACRDAYEMQLIQYVVD